MRNHARAILVCDFFAAISAIFRVIHVFVIIEVGARQSGIGRDRTSDAAWCAQEFRKVMSGDGPEGCRTSDPTLGNATNPTGRVGPLVLRHG